MARGLTAHDATYVTLAAWLHTSLITADREILRIAPSVALGLIESA